MLFNSLNFLVFFPSVTILFFAIPFKYRKFLLLGSSYFFYMLWKPEYGVLIFISTVISFGTGIIIAKKKFEDRRRYVWISLFISLAILFFFKYFNFFNNNLRIIFNHFHFNYPVSNIISVLLPVGISFYTFEKIS